MPKTTQNVGENGGCQKRRETSGKMADASPVGTTDNRQTVKRSETSADKKNEF